MTVAGTTENGSATPSDGSPKASAGGRQSPAAGSGPHSSGTPAETLGPDVSTALATALKIAGAIVAPTTLLTGLLLYFGYQHATALFNHLRVEVTALDLTTRDNLIRSVDGLFVPLAGATAVVLVVLWLRTLLLGTVPAQVLRRAARRTAPLVLVLGLALAAMAVAGIRGSPAFAEAPDLPGICLAGAALLLAYGVRLLRPSPGGSDPARVTPAAVAEWGAVFTVVAVGLFWSTGNYAGGVGTGRAMQIEQELADMPDVVLYSEKDLKIAVEGVDVQECGAAQAPDPEAPTPEAPPSEAPAPEAAYGWRYTGLKLVFQSGDQYVFLPAGWTSDSGTSLLVPRTDSLRLEFTAPGQAQSGSC